MAGGRTELYRRAKKAGSIAQGLFYTFIENTWAQDLRDVRIDRGKDKGVRGVVVTLGPGNDTGPNGVSICERHAGGWLFKFPGEAFSPEGEGVKQALLSHQNGVWAFIVMHVVVAHLFQNLVDDVERDIKEVMHYVPKQWKRLIKYHDASGPVDLGKKHVVYEETDLARIGCAKFVYNIKLKDGAEICLDLTGAQYEFPHQTVMHWKLYAEEWVSQWKYSLPFRKHYEKHSANMEDIDCISHFTIVLEQTIQFTGFLVGSKKHTGHDLAELPDLTGDDFPTAKAIVFSKARDALLIRPTELDSGTIVACTAGDFDLRHPQVVARGPPRPLPWAPHVAADIITQPVDLGDIEDFSWEDLRWIKNMKIDDEVTQADIDVATKMLKNRCVYKMPGNWRMVFLESTLPPDSVPKECVSENPFWKPESEKWRPFVTDWVPAPKRPWTT